VASIGQRFQNHRLYVDVMLGQLGSIIEPNVHPRRSSLSAGPGEFAVRLFLPCQKADFVGLSRGRQERRAQVVPRIKDLISMRRIEARNGAEYEALCQPRIEFTLHANPTSSCAPAYCTVG